MKYLIIAICIWAAAGMKGQDPASQGEKPPGQVDKLPGQKQLTAGQENEDTPAPNRLDTQGRKTGPWKVEYPNGKVRYEATFLEGSPVGEMVRYYDNGAVQARMVFDSTTDRSYTRLYYENGKIAAEGWFVNREKDSVWTYYSEFDGTVRIREPYQQGKLHGTVKNYFPSGEVSEETEWAHHMKEGNWKQYYSEGALRLEGGYEKNELSGPYRVYYPDQTPKVSGNYVENRSEGIWEFFDQSGNLLYSIEYKHGKPVDEEQYQQMLQDSMLRFQAIQDSLQQLQESENPDPFR